MESSAAQLVGVAIPTLRRLRASVLGSSAPEVAVTALRDAGFAGGEAVHAAFEQWLAENGGTGGSRHAEPTRGDASELSLDEFGALAARFFRDAGWGDVAFTADEPEGVAFVEIVNCWEGEADPPDGAAGCHVTTGLLAGFFGRIAGYPVAVLETDCCGGDGTRCRFMLGNADVMNYRWEELRQGAG